MSEENFKVLYELGLNINSLYEAIIKGLYNPKDDLIQVEIEDKSYTISAKKAAKFLVENNDKWTVSNLVKACQNKYEN